jgi:hypothetical protein
MASKYTYIPVAGKYFCCHCNLASLVWVLFVKNRGLHLGIRRRQVPGILKTIIKYRSQPQPSSANILLLPAAGHLCMRVHRGYKIFNLSDLTTTKVFNNDLSEANALSEIKSVRDAGSLDFAPTLLEVDPQTHWYTETFIAGKQSSKNEQSDPKSLFENTIAGHISQIIISKPVRTVGFIKYLNEIRSSIILQLTSAQLNDDLSTCIHDFVYQISARLETRKDVPIQLAFTHGDFSFVNFVHNNSNVVIIDWEGARHRSILHDLYNYFLTELYYERTQSNLISEIDDAILLLNRRLAVSEPLSSKNLVNLKDAYRWLYYLERINMLLDREVSTGILNVIQHSIKVFDKHESSISKYHSE